MKKLVASCIIYFGLAASVAMAQSDKVNLGIGLGLDFGGIGGRLTVMPHKRVGLFGSVGYNLAGVGYNVGAQLRFPTEKRVNFYLTGMYGYNAVLVAKGASTTKTTYYGPTFGFGIEVKGRRNPETFWSYELLFPIRSTAFQDDIDNLKATGYNVTDPFPLAFSLGYHFGFKSNR